MANTKEMTKNGREMIDTLAKFLEWVDDNEELLLEEVDDVAKMEADALVSVELVLVLTEDGVREEIALLALLVEVAEAVEKLTVGPAEAVAKMSDR